MLTHSLQPDGLEDPRGSVNGRRRAASLHHGLLQVCAYLAACVYSIPLSCALWLKYGLLSGDSTVVVVNGTGLLLNLYYLWVYHAYTLEKVRRSQYLDQAIDVLLLRRTCTGRCRSAVCFSLVFSGM